MPAAWAALPYGDARVPVLVSAFKVSRLAFVTFSLGRNALLNLEAADAVEYGADCPWAPVSVPSILELDDPRFDRVKETNVFCFYMPGAADDDDADARVRFADLIDRHRKAGRPIHGVITPRALPHNGQAKVCPEGHVLQAEPAAIVLGNLCDECRAEFRGMAGLCCDLCDFDVCEQCAPAVPLHATRAAHLVSQLQRMGQAKEGKDGEAPAKHSARIIAHLFPIGLTGTIAIPYDDAAVDKTLTVFAEACTQLNTERKLVARGASMGREVAKFVYRTMSGQESGLYKALRMHGQSRDVLAGPKFSMVMLKFVADYLNTCYRGLIRRDDEYVVDSFAKMNAASSTGHHNEICLLTQLFSVIMLFHRHLDRTHYDPTSYETYMASFEEEFERVFERVGDEIFKMFAHECGGGEDITTCDPNKPMFELADEEAPRNRPGQSYHITMGEDDRGPVAQVINRGRNDSAALFAAAWDIDVPRTRVSAEGVLFEVRLRVEQEQWVVHRLYSEFEVLREQVRLQLPDLVENISLPAQPGEDGDPDESCAEMQAFLEHLVQATFRSTTSPFFQATRVRLAHALPFFRADREPPS
eukprot:m.231912 g.231912  ORF g.231912 m.231912 type:complete len:586 (+) comp12275_c0_seq1:85-1842(+)